MRDLEVDLSIITNDNTKKITIVLKKDTTAAGVTWTMDFGLNEPANANDTNFSKQRIKLTVILKPSLGTKAQQTADSGGLTAAQESQAHVANVAAEKLIAKKVSKGFVETQAQ